MNKTIYNLSKMIPDKLYLQLMYYKHFHKFIDFKNPQTFNEKLQWLKLYDRNPEYTKMVDKIEAKKYVADIIGEEYIIPTLKVWDSPDDINLDELPDQFVLKCNHDSKSVAVCKDKNTFDFEAAKKMLGSHLKSNGYWYGREWPYKNVKPKIFAEKYMIDEETNDLRDYKFFCYDGYVDCVMLAMERGSGDTKFYFFDKNNKLLRYNKRGIAAPKDFTLDLPSTMPQMFDIARELSKGLPYARIDLYSCNDKIYFGEITFFPDSGLDTNILPEADLRFGKLLNLANRKEI